MRQDPSELPDVAAPPSAGSEVAESEPATLVVPGDGRVRDVALLAWPVVLQMSAETLLQVITSAFVGRLGATELGAVGFAGVWLWTLLVAFLGAANGVQVFVAQARGAGRERECGPWIWQGFAVLVPASALWAVVAAFGFDALVGAIGPSAELQEQAGLYAAPRFWGIPLVIAGGLATSFFRGIGDTRTPMIAMFVALAAHVTVAYGLIFGAFGLPAWGVYGAGLSILISEAVFAVVLYGAALTRTMRRRYATGPTRPGVAPVRRFLRTSAPIGGQWLLDMVSFAIFTSIIARMGDTQMAASQAMLQLLSLSFMQAVAISIGTGALVGQYIGAKRLDAAERSFVSGMWLVGGLALLIAALFIGLPEQLMRLFSSDPGVLELARPLLLLGALFQAFDAIQIVASGALRGAGDTRWSFLVSASLAWVLRLPLVYALAIVLEGGVYGAWLAELGLMLVLSAAFVTRFRRGRWRSIRI